MNNQERKLEKIEVVHLNYQSFHDSMVKQTPEEIYNSSHQITAVQEFYSCMLNCEDDRIDEMICLFVEHKVDFEKLCECFEENCNSSVSSYENTIEFFNYVLENKFFSGMENETKKIKKQCRK